LITSVRAAVPLYPRGPRSGPGYAVLLHLHSLNRPHPPHSRAHLDFTVSRLTPDALAVPIPIGLGHPRLVLSFRGWSLATCRLPGPRGTFRLLLPSASPKTLAFDSKEPSRHSRISSHADSREGAISGLHYSSLSLRPAALLALLSELTGLSSSQRGLLLPGFRRFGHPRRRRISLQCQLGNMH
jgi:hypothetical protein